ncbi:DNA/RNA helicase domain-containing protein [uncultured Piscinibacter sp.]|uniref:DNA/RNA helicase domain-containing protein n=1 Tax=uncultured Piscinibacter sp. TaxID=1131835 RepID=UPI00345C2239
MRFCLRRGPWTRSCAGATLICGRQLSSLKGWRAARVVAGVTGEGLKTLQGFEFDYVGIIFGPDLRHERERNTWVSAVLGVDLNEAVASKLASNAGKDPAGDSTPKRTQDPCGHNAPTRPRPTRPWPLPSRCDMARGLSSLQSPAAVQAALDEFTKLGRVASLVHGKAGGPRFGKVCDRVRLMRRTVRRRTRGSSMSANAPLAVSCCSR